MIEKKVDKRSTVQFYLPLDFVTKFSHVATLVYAGAYERKEHTSSKLHTYQPSCTYR